MFQYTPLLQLPPRPQNKIIVRNGEQFQEMINFLNSSPFLTFDTETSGLAWYKHASICGLALAGECDGDLKCFYIPVRHRTGESQLNLSMILLDLKNLFNKDTLKIAHNFKFDLHMIKKEGIVIYGKFYDTLIAAKLYNENDSAALKDRARLDLGITNANDWESRVDIEITNLAKLNGLGKDAYRNRWGYSQLPIDLCGLYACYDVDFTTQLYRYYEHIGISQLYSRVFNTEMSLISVLCDMEENGMPIDVDYLHNLRQKLELRKIEIEECIFYNYGFKHFNLASDSELCSFLQSLGICLSKQTKKGALAVDKEVLTSFKDIHPVIPLIEEWKEVEKLYNTYTTSILERLDTNSIIHCDFQQMGTIASRLSCKDPNLQNQPSDDDDRAIKFSGKSLEIGGVDPWSIRRAYHLLSPEWVRVYADYSQIELRVLTFYTKDPIMWEAYLKGEDIHTRTSLEVFGSKEKKWRGYAKIINFGLVYMMTAMGLARNAKIPLEEAEQYLDKFFVRYAGVPKFREEFFTYIRANGGFFQNLFGRPRRISDISNNNNWERGKAERQAIATLIQGTAGELTKESLVRIDNRIKNDNLKELVLPVCTIHDELQYDCHISVFPKFCRIVKEEMENYPEFSPIPMLISGEYTTTNWAEKRKINYGN